MSTLLLLSLLAACDDPAALNGLPDGAVPPVYQTGMYVRDAEPGGVLGVTLIGLPPGASVDLYRGNRSYGSLFFPGTRIESGMNPLIRVNTSPLVADAAGTASLSFVLPPEYDAGESFELQPFSQHPDFWLPGYTSVWVARPGCVDDAAESDDSEGLALWLAPGDDEALRSCPDDVDVTKVWLQPGDQVQPTLTFDPRGGAMELEIDGDPAGVFSPAAGVVQGSRSALASGFRYVSVGLAADAGAPGLDYTLRMDVTPSPFPVYAFGAPSDGRLINLDDARVSSSGEASLTEVIWQVATRQGVKYRELIPRGGAALLPMGQDQPTVQECAAVSMSRARISEPRDAPVALADGSWFCARTGEGRLALFQLEQLPGLNGGRTTINTWEDQPAWRPVMWGGLSLEAQSSPGSRNGVDLDAGQARAAGESADLTVSYANGKWRFAPTLLAAGQPRAKLWRPPEGAGPEVCAAGVFSSQAVQIATNASRDAQLCVRTRAGQIGAVTITSTDPTNARLSVDYARWSAP
jgi:hypothetical protein